MALPDAGDIRVLVENPCQQRCSRLGCSNAEENGDVVLGVTHPQLSSKGSRPVVTPISGVRLLQWFTDHRLFAST